jgi:hypothetical protein
MRTALEVVVFLKWARPRGPLEADQKSSSLIKLTAAGACCFGVSLPVQSKSWPGSLFDKCNTMAATNKCLA